MSEMRVPTINESEDNEVERIRARLESAEELLQEARDALGPCWTRKCIYEFLIRRLI